VKQTPLELIDALRELDVLLFGEGMLDTYLHGQTRRLCREAPVPILDLSNRHDAPSGAANAAASVRSLPFVAERSTTDLIERIGSLHVGNECASVGFR
jgi:D-beta-D-heptose 7-phosphate kinase/D-beta-D-heptose 1-phosphate adenosyltransferase